MAKGKTAQGTAIKQINMRRCAACRQIHKKSELLRVTKTSAGDIFLDTTGKASGRGVYVCKSSECATIFKKRRCIDRAFKVNVPNELYDKICAAIVNDGLA